MHLHLRNIKGIKKLLDDLKKLDSDIKVINYGDMFYDIESTNLKCLVTYDYKKETQILWVYDNEWGKTTNVGHELKVAIKFIDCLFSN